MAKNTCDFKHKIYCNIYIYIYIYIYILYIYVYVYICSSLLHFKTPSNEVISLEVTNFTKISILDVCKGSEYVTT